VAVKIPSTRQSSVTTTDLTLSRAIALPTWLARPLAATVKTGLVITSVTC